HFPVMPRLFMAVQQEDRFPVVDILQQTPEIPENAQCAVVLRNHAELTLEMVSDEERDSMYRSYARNRQARINLGIRRRLAPLLGNDRRKIELMNALLLSLPGTPILYYGDELGMGDNIYLGDRNGVRTPMQWSADRNAGFSRANPQQLYLPVIIDPEYHFEALSVEAQHNNPNSLFWWTKRMIALRKRLGVMGRGNIDGRCADGCSGDRRLGRPLHRARSRRPGAGHAHVAAIPPLVRGQGAPHLVAPDKRHCPTARPHHADVRDRLLCRGRPRHLRGPPGHR